MLQAIFWHHSVTEDPVTSLEFSNDASALKVLWGCSSPYDFYVFASVVHLLPLHTSLKDDIIFSGCPFLLPWISSVFSGLCIKLVILCAILPHPPLFVVTEVMMMDLFCPCIAMKLSYLPFSLYLRVQKNSDKWSFILQISITFPSTLDASMKTATNHFKTLKLTFTLLIKCLCFTHSYQV